MNDKDMEVKMPQKLSFEKVPNEKNQEHRKMDTEKMDSRFEQTKKRVAAMKKHKEEMKIIEDAEIKNTDDSKD